MSFEYGLSGALNAVGFMRTMKFAVNEMGLHIPDWIFYYEFSSLVQLNPLACLMIVGFTLLMLKGIKESILVNNILTVGILAFYGYCNILSANVYNP